jgi:hypothetical protein
MSKAMAKAASLVRKPRNKAIGPRNSVKIARIAKTAGICILSLKDASVVAKPPPPNQPRTFCAPCGNMTIPRSTRKMSGETDSEV